MVHLILVVKPTKLSRAKVSLLFETQFKAVAMFKDKVVWITGASSGIGEALAKRLAKQGSQLILSGRNSTELARVAAACEGEANVKILPFEATDFDGLPNIVSTALAQFGHVDCLINNAGISQRSLALDTDFGVYQKVIEIDLMAPIALTQALLPSMVARKTGRFIVISSVAGKVGVPLRTAYCAAKHGLFGYFDALRAETSIHGIEVNMVAPGSVKTNVSRNALQSDGSKRGESDAAIEAGMSADHAAKLMLAAIARGEREIILARGMERKLVSMRKKSPDRLFELVGTMVAQGYAQDMKVGE
jgi:dehydrogenase/reductase SDR family member 7B